jgi:hypothetical protein
MDARMIDARVIDYDALVQSTVGVRAEAWRYAFHGAQGDCS